MMRPRLQGFALLGLAAATVSVVSPDVASGAGRCVGGPGCYSTVQAAVDAAQNGDTITIAPGRFAGGITISKSLRIVGTGPRQTTISGGGPVVTIGDSQSAHQPTVMISDLAVTDGVTHGDGVNAAGGGIEVAPGPGFTLGATLYLGHVSITGNRVAPTKTIAVGPPCPGGPCPFAEGDGGGIANFGTTTIEDSTISGNTVAGVASDARGGGISSYLGSLSLNDVAVIGNRAVVVAPNGRFAEGGGVFVDSGSLDVRHSTGEGNTATLSSSLPSFAGASLINMNANSGGIHVGDGIPTTISGVQLLGNSARASDTNGEPLGFDAAMLIGDSPLTMRDTAVERNHATTISATTADSGPGGSAIELDGGGTITDSVIVENAAIQRSRNGTAGVNGALAILNFNNDAKLVTVRDSVIARNTAAAASSTGAAITQGVGIYNDSLLTLTRVQVRANSGKADGRTSIAQGGGIFNSDELSGPPVELTLRETEIVGNALSGGPDATLQGGGLFTTLPVDVNDSRIAHNQPDQCYGCSPSPQGRPRQHPPHTAQPHGRPKVISLSLLARSPSAAGTLIWA